MYRVPYFVQFTRRVLVDIHQRKYVFFIFSDTPCGPMDVCLIIDTSISVASSDMVMIKKTLLRLIAATGIDPVDGYLVSFYE